MKNRSISSQNVDSANIYNHGIVKAGDGGNGRRGADGRGGTDKTDGTAPTNGTYGATHGGEYGAAGAAYYYSGSTKTATKDETAFINASAGAGWSGETSDTWGHGNDGWGGLNLTRYWNIKDGRHGTSTRESEGRTIYVNQVEAETLKGSINGEQSSTNIAIIYKQFTSLEQETPGFLGLNILVRSGKDWKRNDDEIVFAPAITYSIGKFDFEIPAYYSLRTYAGYDAGWYNGTGGTKTYTNNQNTYGNISIYYNITGSYGYKSTKYTYNNVTFNVYAGPEGEFLSAVCRGSEIEIIQ